MGNNIKQKNAVFEQQKFSKLPYGSVDMLHLYSEPGKLNDSVVLNNAYGQLVQNDMFLTNELKVRSRESIGPDSGDDASVYDGTNGYKYWVMEDGDPHIYQKIDNDIQDSFVPLGKSGISLIEGCGGRVLYSDGKTSYSSSQKFKNMALEELKYYADFDAFQHRDFSSGVQVGFTARSTNDGDKLFAGTYTLNGKVSNCLFKYADEGLPALSVDPVTKLDVPYVDADGNQVFVGHYVRKVVGIDEPDTITAVEYDPSSGEVAYATETGVFTCQYAPSSVRAKGVKRIHTLEQGEKIVEIRFMNRETASGKYKVLLLSDKAKLYYSTNGTVFSGTSMRMASSSVRFGFPLSGEYYFCASDGLYRFGKDQPVSTVAFDSYHVCSGKVLLMSNAGRMLYMLDSDGKLTEYCKYEKVHPGLETLAECVLGDNTVIAIASDALYFETDRSNHVFQPNEGTTELLEGGYRIVKAYGFRHDAISSVYLFLQSSDGHRKMALVNFDATEDYEIDTSNIVGTSTIYAFSNEGVTYKEFVRLNDRNFLVYSASGYTYVVSVGDSVRMVRQFPMFRCVGHIVDQNGTLYLFSQQKAIKLQNAYDEDFSSYSEVSFRKQFLGDGEMVTNGAAYSVEDTSGATVDYVIIRHTAGVTLLKVVNGMADVLGTVVNGSAGADFLPVGHNFYSLMTGGMMKYCLGGQTEDVISDSRIEYGANGVVTNVSHPGFVMDGDGNVQAVTYIVRDMQTYAVKSSYVYSDDPDINNSETAVLGYAVAQVETYCANSGLFLPAVGGTLTFKYRRFEAGATIAEDDVDSYNQYFLQSAYCRNIDYLNSSGDANIIALNIPAGAVGAVNFAQIVGTIQGSIQDESVTEGVDDYWLRDYTDIVTLGLDGIRFVGICIGNSFTKLPEGEDEITYYTFAGVTYTHILVSAPLAGISSPHDFVVFSDAGGQLVSSGASQYQLFYRKASDTALYQRTVSFDTETKAWVIDDESVVASFSSPIRSVSRKGNDINVLLEDGTLCQCSRDGVVSDGLHFTSPTADVMYLQSLPDASDPGTESEKVAACNINVYLNVANLDRAIFMAPAARQKREAAEPGLAVLPAGGVFVGSYSALRTVRNGFQPNGAVALNLHGLVDLLLVDDSDEQAVYKFESVFQDKLTDISDIRIGQLDAVLDSADPANPSYTMSNSMYVKRSLEWKLVDFKQGDGDETICRVLGIPDSAAAEDFAQYYCDDSYFNTLFMTIDPSNPAQTLVKTLEYNRLYDVGMSIYGQSDPDQPSLPSDFSRITRCYYDATSNAFIYTQDGDSNVYQLDNGTFEAVSDPLHSGLVQYVCPGRVFGEDQLKCAAVMKVFANPDKCKLGIMSETGTVYLDFVDSFSYATPGHSDIDYLSYDPEKRRYYISYTTNQSAYVMRFEGVSVGADCLFQSQNVEFDPAVYGTGVDIISAGGYGFVLVFRNRLYSYTFDVIDGEVADYGYDILRASSGFSKHEKYASDTDIWHMIADGSLILKTSNMRTWQQLCYVDKVGAPGNVAALYYQDSRSIAASKADNLWYTQYSYTVVDNTPRFTEEKAIALYQRHRDEMDGQIQAKVQEHEVTQHSGDTAIDLINQYTSRQFEIDDAFTDGEFASESEAKIQNDYIAKVMYGASQDMGITVGVKNTALGNSQSEVYKPVEDVTYIAKCWKSGLVDLYLHLPTTYTYYVPHVQYAGFCRLPGGTTVKVNGKQLQPTISANYTTINVSMLSTAFHIDCMLGNTIKGASLPLAIYKDSVRYEDEEGEASEMFHSFMEPSVAKMAEASLLATTYDAYSLKYYCFGTDEQNIHLQFVDSDKTYLKSYQTITYHGRQGLTDNGLDTVTQRILEDDIEKPLYADVFHVDNGKFVGWTTHKSNTLSADFQKTALSYGADEFVGGSLNLYAVWMFYTFTKDDTLIEVNAETDETYTIAELTIDPNTDLQNMVAIDFDSKLEY